jgi:Ca-activated chloride channel homolog
VGLEVKYPYLFLLFIPAAFLIFLFCRQAVKSGQMNHETALIAGLRSFVFMLIIFALTVPQVLLPVKGETIVFLVDRSASVKGTEEKVLDWIEKSVSGKGKDDSYAIVSFGKNAVTEQALGKKSMPVLQFNGKIDDRETDIESAIQFASSMFSGRSNGRIILFTDGNETTGSGIEAANLLKNEKIELDIVQLNLPEYDDMAISALSVPPALYKGEKAPISLTINSSAAKDATIRISVNDQEVITKKVAVKEGTNVYTFLHKVEETGLIVYKGELVAENDRFTENNALYSVSTVKGTPKVLIVQGKESGQIASILKESGLLVETLPPEKLPSTLTGLLKYQSIIFNNVPATEISENQMNLIEKAVKEFGTGFVMAGGEESFGLGGYFKTPIEKLLPVHMDIKGKNEMPSLGLVIVMDRSGSMAGSKLSLAKEAAARSVELMRDDDTLGFIAFDDRPWEIVKTQPIKNKKKVMEKIRSVTSGGGTEIFSSLEKAYQELENLKLQRKHIILLTDGQSSTNGDYDSLIEGGKEKNITLSTVALGQDADRALLEYLAEAGGGRYYDVTDSSVVPSILSRETVMATRTYIEDHPFYPTIRPHPDWAPLFQDGVPKMNAYIATTAKSRANVPIISEKKDPILSEWQYGMGYAIAFTSDFSGKWSGDWAAWPKWTQFINQLITKTLPKYDHEPFKLSLDRRGWNTIVNLESSVKRSLPIEVSIVSEKGDVIDANTKLTAPGKYEVVMPDVAGMYFIRINETDENGMTHMYQTGFAVPYSDEYLLKGTNKELLRELSNSAGGKVLINEKDAFRPLKTQSYTKQSISHWLLLAAFFLYFVEIALRRFGLKRLTRFFTIRKNNQPVPETEKAKKIEQLNTAKQNWSRPLLKKPSHKMKDHSSEKTNNKKERRKSANDTNVTTEVEREERLKRLLDAKNRKNR